MSERGRVVESEVGEDMVGSWVQITQTVEKTLALTLDEMEIAVEF